MGNRILKGSIRSSVSIDALTYFQEVFFYRLIVSVDDYGCLDARPVMLRSTLFPSRDNVPIEEIQRAVAALEAQGMLRRYTANGQPYLMLTGWEKHQSLRRRRHLYPMPEEGAEEVTAQETPTQDEPMQEACAPADGGQVTADGGQVTADGGQVTADGGQVAADGGQAPASGGQAPASGGQVAADVRPESESESKSESKSESESVSEARAAAGRLRQRLFRAYSGLPGEECLELEALLAGGMQEDAIVFAANEAARRGMRSWRYVNAMLADWRRRGITSSWEARRAIPGCQRFDYMQREYLPGELDAVLLPLEDVS